VIAQEHVIYVIKTPDEEVEQKVKKLANELNIKIECGIIEEMGIEIKCTIMALPHLQSVTHWGGFFINFR